MSRLKFLLIALLLFVITTSVKTNSISSPDSNIENSNGSWRFVEKAGLFNFYTDIPIEEHDEAVANSRCNPFQQIWTNVFCNIRLRCDWRQLAAQQAAYPRCIRADFCPFHSDDRYGLMINETSEDLQPLIGSGRLRFAVTHRQRYSCYQIKMPLSVSFSDVEHFILSQGDWNLHSRFSLPQPELAQGILYRYYGTYKFQNAVQLCMVTHRELITLLNLPSSFVVSIHELETVYRLTGHDSSI